MKRIAMAHTEPKVSSSFCKSSDARVSTPEPGLTRRIGASNRKLMLAEHHMKKGWVGARHSHPHEQLVYVVSGHIRATVGTHTFEARTGDSFVVAGGTEHEAMALADSIVVDVFTPARDEYLP